MSDTDNNHVEPAAPHTLAGDDDAPQNDGRTFTQEEVNRHIVDRLAKEKRKHERELDELRQQIQQQTQAEPKKRGRPKADDPNTDILQRLEAMERENLVSKLQAAAAMRDVKDSYLHDLLVAAYDRDKPSDFDLWIDEQTGKLKQYTQSSQPQTDAAPTQDRPDTRSDAGAPTQGRNPIDVADPTSLSSDDINRLKSEGRFKDYLDRYRESLNGGRPRVFGSRLPKR